MPRRNKRDQRWVAYFPEIWDDESPGSLKPRTKRNRPQRLRDVR